jgi:hypothetical protein
MEQPHRGNMMIAQGNALGAMPWVSSPYPTHSLDFIRARAGCAMATPRGGNHLSILYASLVNPLDLPPDTRVIPISPHSIILPFSLQRRSK